MNYKSLKLPYCEHLDDSKPQALVERIVSDRTSAIELATSKFGLSESEWEECYPAFGEFYEARAKEISELLGSPAWQGSWTSDDYPDWALGEEITVWDHPRGKIYLRIYHEDEEIPVVVALGTRDSKDGFNAEGESSYKAEREHLRANQ